jgi:signal recognition particle GTPase
VSRRRWVSAREIFKALGCHDEASCRALSRSQRQDREEPPHLILLGGGMGAGKTTLKKMVSQSDFWRRHGQNVVSVEADHFKEIDPVYQLLTRLNQPKASEAVHTYSTQAAEELFLSALKFKRDIIFDSTLGKKYRTEERRMAKAG